MKARYDANVRAKASDYVLHENEPGRLEQHPIISKQRAGVGEFVLHPFSSKRKSKVANRECEESFDLYASEPTHNTIKHLERAASIIRKVYAHANTLFGRPVSLGAHCM